MTACLAGVVDAAVSGGVANYESFFTGGFRSTHPEVGTDVASSPEKARALDELREALRKQVRVVGPSRAFLPPPTARAPCCAQVVILRRGIEVHAVKCAAAMVPLHEHVSCAFARARARVCASQRSRAARQPSSRRWWRSLRNGALMWLFACEYEGTVTLPGGRPLLLLCDRRTSIVNCPASESVAEERVRVALCLAFCSTEHRWHHGHTTSGAALDSPPAPPPRRLPVTGHGRYPPITINRCRPIAERHFRHTHTVSSPAAQLSARARESASIMRSVGVLIARRRALWLGTGALLLAAVGFMNAFSSTHSTAHAPAIRTAFKPLIVSRAGACPSAGRAHALRCCRFRVSKTRRLPRGGWMLGKCLHQLPHPQLAFRP